MLLSELLDSVGQAYSEQWNKIEVTGIAHNSRKLKDGNIFVCIEGETSDGHKYVNDAVSKGASAIVATKTVDVSVPVIYVDNSRAFMAKLAEVIYKLPEDMKLFGVTGTNGKTTTTFFFRSICHAAGMDCGIIGTTGIYYGDVIKNTENTTPDTLETYEILHEMYDVGVRNVIIEASSQGLDMHRLDGFSFQSSAFTNITFEHLYYHKTFENYFIAKAKLFDLTSGAAVLNKEDRYYSRLQEIVKTKVISYGYSETCNIYPTELETSLTQSKFILNIDGQKAEVLLNIPFGYNILNSLAAAGLAHSAGISPEHIAKGLGNLSYIPGRVNFLNQQPLVIVDFAHTPHGLQNFLKEIRKRKSGRLITIFGCIGERDIDKRKYMAQAANRYSDLIIFTTDNPRNESPDDIAEYVKPYFTKEYIIEHDRKRAILTAFRNLTEDDILVILGKGHETYQIIGNKKVEHNDEVIVKEFLRGNSVTRP